MNMPNATFCKPKTAKESFSILSITIYQLNDHNGELDPVGSTVRYEMMKLCTGCLSMRRWQLVIDDTGSVEGICVVI